MATESFKKRILLIVLFMLSLCISSAAAADYVLKNYRDLAFNYMVSLPDGWKMTNIDLWHRQVVILNDRKSAEIKLTASSASQEEKQKWEKWREWFAEGGPDHIIKIEEDSRSSIGPDIDARLILCQVRKKGKIFLQRIFIASMGNRLVVMEFSAPPAEFVLYSALFNEVAGSLRNLEADAQGGN